PMGLGSGYGSLSPVSFDQIAKYLGFDAGPKNPVAAAFYRGFDDIDVSSLLVKIMIFYSRISADMILYSSGSTPFLILPESFLTGSSLMPNKRNPDFLEMVQGYASQLTADFAASAAILANRNTGYHREFQVSKDRTVHNILLVESISKHMNQLT
ncbi:argininosuccinate lyase, partial [mine drainage metagenome]